MSYCREDEGLPEGYVSRGGKLALCIKVRRGPTAAEVAEVGAELVVTGVAPPADGAALPWSLAWLEALANAEPESYAVFERFAFESEHKYAEEYARELFGRGVKLWTDGRSGGWLVLGEHGAPDVDAAREALDLIHAHENPAGGGAPPMGEHESDYLASIAEARALLAALEKFREHVAAVVADFPRAVAWQACANGFEPAALEFEAAEKRRKAEERLDVAVSGVVTALRESVDRFDAQGQPYADGEAMLAEFDAARTALEFLVSDCDLPEEGAE
jgi:hypothetical protein